MLFDLSDRVAAVADRLNRRQLDDAHTGAVSRQKYRDKSKRRTHQQNAGFHMEFQHRHSDGRHRAVCEVDRGLISNDMM